MTCPDHKGERMNVIKQMICPLVDGRIDSDLCCEVQECIEGNISVTLELEDFLEKDDCVRICRTCKYNILSDRDSVCKIGNVDYFEEYRKQTGKDMETGDYIIQ